MMRNDGDRGRSEQSTLGLAGAMLGLFVLSSALGVAVARWLFSGAPAVDPPDPPRPLTSPAHIVHDDEPLEVVDRLASADRDEAPEPPSASPARACAGASGDNPKGDYVVQVASHAAAAPAEQDRRRLKTAGYVAFVSRVDLAGRGTHYRVLVGPFVSRRAAEDCRSDLGAEAGVKAWVHKVEHLPSAQEL